MRNAIDNVLYIDLGLIEIQTICNIHERIKNLCNISASDKLRSITYLDVYDRDKIE